MLGCLPDYEPVSKSSNVYWGRKSDGAEIRLNTTNIVNAYNRETNWQKDTFLVPYGKIGRDFTDQLTKHINDWNNNTEMQHIALTAAIVHFAQALQKTQSRFKSERSSRVLIKEVSSMVRWRDSHSRSRRANGTKASHKASKK